MEPERSFVNGIASFVQSSGQFLKGMFQWCSDAINQNPVKMKKLRCLQTEGFSDMMKLRDTQDKIEDILSFSKFRKGFPFQILSTPIEAIICADGVLLFVEDDVQQACNAIDRAGIRSGIHSRLMLETVVRQKDALVVEFVASQKRWTHTSEGAAWPLSLASLKYSANLNDWLSVVLVPLGARCKNVGISSDLGQGHLVSGLCLFGPPLFNLRHSCAAGLIFKGSDVVASLAELFSGRVMEPDPAGDRMCLSTFAQVAYGPSEDIKITLSGLWQMSRPPSQLTKFGMLAIPLHGLKRHTSHGVRQQASPIANRGAIRDGSSAESFALMLDSDLKKSTKIGGWVEVQRSSSSLLQWGVSVSDTPDDELGWGLRLGGIVKEYSTQIHLEGSEHLNQFHLEGFLNFNLGKHVTLQPGLMVVMDRRARTPAIIFHSSWFM